jgi:hypothetical protein
VRGQRRRIEREQRVFGPVREERGGPSREKARERAQVAAQHREQHVGAACRGVLGRARLEERHVALGAREREQAQRGDALRGLARRRRQRLERLETAESIELWAELERDERIEEGVAPDLACDRRVQRDESALGDAPRAEQRLRELDVRRERAPQRAQRLVGRVLRERLLDEAALRRVVRG